MVSDLNAIPAGTAAAVDPEVLHWIAECAADLNPHQAELVTVLHARLAELSPALVRLPGEGRPLCQRLVAVALHAADPGRPPAHAAGVVAQVGADNYQDGFAVDQYGPVTHALLHSVREVFSGEWSSTLSSAWVEYLLWLRTLLMAGAEEARARAPEQGDAAGDGGTVVLPDVDPFAARAAVPPADRLRR